MHTASDSPVWKRLTIQVSPRLLVCFIKHLAYSFERSLLYVRHFTAEPFVVIVI